MEETFKIGDIILLNEAGVFFADYHRWRLFAHTGVIVPFNRKKDVSDKRFCVLFTGHRMTKLVPIGSFGITDKENLFNENKYSKTRITEYIENKCNKGVVRVQKTLTEIDETLFEIEMNSRRPYEFK